MQIFHGDIIHSESWDKLSVVEGGYIVVNGSGTVEGVFASLPEQYAGAPVTDCGRGVIIPAFSDLHIHASQYPQMGTAMDVLLSCFNVILRDEIGAYMNEVGFIGY